MSAAIERIKANAERLAIVRQNIRALEEEHERKSEALVLEREELQLALLTELKKEGLSSIKTEDKDTYSIGSRKGIAIKSEIGAMKWAIEHRTVSIDKRLVAAALKDVAEVPDCFEVVESEFISIRSPKPAVEKPAITL